MQTEWPFKEGDDVIYEPKRKRFGIPVPAIKVRVKKIYPGAGGRFSVVELRCGQKKQIETKSLHPIVS